VAVGLAEIFDRQLRDSRKFSQKITVLNHFQPRFAGTSPRYRSAYTTARLSFPAHFHATVGSSRERSGISAKLPGQLFFCKGLPFVFIALLPVALLAYGPALHEKKNGLPAAPRLKRAGPS